MVRRFLRLELAGALFRRAAGLGDADALNRHSDMKEADQSNDPPSCSTRLLPIRVFTTL